MKWNPMQLWKMKNCNQNAAWASGRLIEENRFITVTPETEVLKAKQLIIVMYFMMDLMSNI
ncbi:hypothetical protein KY290_027121 [Solanum tuberosum]|uniref:Uncharacterized protein n=1 Tax=Solanum tuberosum TaxID=4113 RepID=A0ABQ7UEP7_SOLTU|nr:hypothetical protein KY284_026083 [Solanum tuberosum]KAH0747889.1 hypothetical protein KY290_027121 [Solanum tuberosum]